MPRPNDGNTQELLPTATAGDSALEPGECEIIDRAGGLPEVSRGAAARSFLGEFEAMFEHAPVAMILVNRQRLVLRLNRAAYVLAGQAPGTWSAGPQGLLLGCPNRHDVPDGCGAGPRCPSCAMRQIIDRSFETRAPASQIEASTQFALGDRIEERTLRISSSYLEVTDGERTLLCVEDITERRLPPGAPGGPLPPAK